MFQSKRNSDPSSHLQLELEAADYFKLDPAQVNMLCNSSPAATMQQQQQQQRQQERKSAAGASGGRARPTPTLMKPLPPKSPLKQTTEPKSATRSHNNLKPARQHHHKRTQSISGKQSAAAIISAESKPRRFHANQDNKHPEQIHSSTASTNSLPSISSSPSISPSLVCPHLTLDDILEGRYMSRSPHTIGLCDRCKLDPPPNVHSPLSPIFRPSTTATTTVNGQTATKLNQFFESNSNNQYSTRVAQMRRGYSDLQQRCVAPQRQQLRDDSLDFYLEPSELRRSQMSPIQRNSVEFIRKYSTEVGRVLKVYKNGQPFEKPLRICITRNEFANLNQLLDHINSRQLVPGGARYLFHLDGQLVYSVNELKHGSSYVVSGTRQFDIKASTTIKEQQKKELNQTHHLHEQLQRKLLDRRSSRSLGSLGQLARSDDSAEAAVTTYNIAKLSKEPPPSDQPVKPTIKSIASDDQQKPATKTTKPTKPAIHKGVSRKTAVRPDLGEHMSRSSENLNQVAIGGQDSTTKTSSKQQKGGNLSRAKSELSPSALKRKKNVTFMDTGQSASPVMRRSEEPKAAEPIADADLNANNKVLERNEIGIQVSDSIDGYLIDLPLPLPKRGDERREQLESRRKFVATNRGANKASTTTGKDPSTIKASSSRRIVTITERDLSLEELDQLKDLDHGDHHSEPHKIKHVVIKLDSIDADTEPADEPAAGGEKSESAQEEPIDRTGTINIGQELNNADRLITKTEFDDDQRAEAPGVAMPAGQWQYPGGQLSSATPEERPVSQSEPNGFVNARVTTPTPSLSTAGDNNSLSLSYEAVQLVDGKSRLEQQARSGGDSKAATPRRSLPPKSRVPVVGELSDGIDPPEKNFELTWVNGFSINDLYPDNSTTVANAPSATSLVVLESAQQNELLSPAKQQAAQAAAAQRVAVQFKPSDRYRNWICHSRLHDELIYPAGCLVVLWCRWTDEQRYYSRHSTNVTALALAPTEADIVASSEAGGSPELPDKQAVIHLWSSTSLETLVVVDEPLHFRGFRVFSLSLRKPATVAAVDEQQQQESTVCSLLVASRDDKATLQLHAIRVALQKVNTMSKVTIIKAPSRVLQPNQIPLLVSHVPMETKGTEIKTPKTKRLDLATSDLLLSFGRRHFQLWAPEWTRQKLQLMVAGEKSGAFTEIMTKASCLARLAPSEFLIGDSLGNISLVSLVLPQQQQTPSKGSPRSAAAATTTASNKYDIRVVRLVDKQKLVGAQSGDQLSSSRSPAPSGADTSSITSLTRISGSLFASGHSDCAVIFWKIERSSLGELSCRQLTCVTLPPDLGFICSIVSSGFNRQRSIVEFYLISTSNAILFGSIQLAALGASSPSKQPANILAHSSLSVVYEGHETSVTNLVADSLPVSSKRAASGDGHYFTCSLDFKICKWLAKSLVWKSMLPSACVSMAVHPTGFVLAVGSADGTVYVLDKISGLLISYFPLTPVCINCLSYSRDGTLLAAGCANGSIFILPVQENGLKYKKVSIFQSPFPVVSLQFSLDNRYLLTSVTHSQYQDLILWDLPNFRYMRDNVRMVADKINWFEPVCSGSEDVRAIWENANLAALQPMPDQPPSKNRLARKRPSAVGLLEHQQLVVNLSCHRLVGGEPSLCIASDTRGHLRLFRYPCRNIDQAFQQARVTSSRMNCCRFLFPQSQSFVSSALDGSIFLWSLALAESDVKQQSV